jgi:methyl-accepting chemotaxis protein
MSEKKTFFRLNIFTKILLTMLLVALIPFGSLWYINYDQSKETWEDKTALTLNNTTTSLANKIDAWMDMNLRVLRQNASLDAILSMNAAQQNPVLKTIGASYQWSYLVFTIGLDGQNIGRSDDKPVIQYGDRVYFKDVMAGKPMGHEVIMSRTTGKPALVISTPITDADRTKRGVIAMGMHLDDISKATTNIRIGQTGFAILLDENGKAIAHGKSGFLREALQDLSKHPALSHPEATKKFAVYQEGDKKVVAHADKTQQGWTVIVQQDLQEALAPLYQAQQNALIVLVVSLVLLVAIAYLFSQRLAHPIRQLTVAAEKISMGELNEKIVATDRSDEIGGLARAIERMGISLKMALERLRA